MSTKIITTRSDLRGWLEQQLANHVWDSIDEDYEEVIGRMLTQLQSEDTPSWGDDWADWLDGIELNAPWEWLAGDRETIS